MSGYAQRVYFDTEILTAERGANRLSTLSKQRPRLSCVLVQPVDKLGIYILFGQILLILYPASLGTQITSRVNEKFGHGVVAVAD